MQLIHKGSKIQVFDIILVSTKRNPISWLIQKATNCKYNHAAIVGECFDELWVYEAKSKGFYPTKPLSKWIKDHEDNGDELCFLKPKDYTMRRKNGFDKISDLLGKNYEFLNLTIFQLFRIVFSVYPGPKNSNQVICSEAIAKIYDDIFPNYWQTTPKEIFEEEKLMIKLEC